MSIATTVGTGPRPALIAIEGPSYGSKGNALHQLAGLWWIVYDALTRARMPIVVIPPGQLKKYATGKGTADKTAMAVALQRRADIELGDDNQVDAWWLAAAALDHLGHPIVDLPKAQREALAKVAWPEMSA
jgi:Holliday junction resolvasome RuvABC endonuclease subunit